MSLKQKSQFHLLVPKGKTYKSESETKVQHIAMPCDATGFQRPSAAEDETNSSQVQAVHNLTTTTSAASETEEHLIQMIQNGDLVDILCWP